MFPFFIYKPGCKPRYIKSIRICSECKVLLMAYQQHMALRFIYKVKVRDVGACVLLYTQGLNRMDLIYSTVEFHIMSLYVEIMEKSGNPLSVGEYTKNVRLSLYSSRILCRS